MKDKEDNKVVKFNIGNLKPGEDAELVTIGPASPARDLARITLNYNDEYGNEYQTIAIISWKKRKILRQEFKKIKIVKDVGDNYPEIEIEEDSIDWGMIG